MVLLNTCLRCGQPTRQPATGRPRLYCSDQCRKRAQRSRRQALITEATAPAESAVDRALLGLPADILGLPRDPDEAVAQAVGQALAAVRVLGLCGEMGRSQLRWRCAKAAEEIRDTLRRYFTMEAGESAGLLRRTRQPDEPETPS